MTTVFKIRRDTSVNWGTKNTVLAEGEFGLDINTHMHKIGDGITPWNTLTWDMAGQKGDTGAAGEGGQILIDFGPEPGLNEASVFVNDANILLTSIPIAKIAGNATSDHTIQDHIFISMLIQLVCETPIPGSGFTIHAISNDKLSGTYNCNYLWV